MRAPSEHARAEAFRRSDKAIYPLLPEARYCVTGVQEYLVVGVKLNDPGATGAGACVIGPLAIVEGEAFHGGRHVSCRITNATCEWL